MARAVVLAVLMGLFAQFGIAINSRIGVPGGAPVDSRSRLSVPGGAPAPMPGGE